MEINVKWAVSMEDNELFLRMNVNELLVGFSQHAAIGEYIVHVEGFNEPHGFARAAAFEDAVRAIGAFLRLHNLVESLDEAVGEFAFVCEFLQLLNAYYVQLDSEAALQAFTEDAVKSMTHTRDTMDA